MLCVQLALVRHITVHAERQARNKQIPLYVRLRYDHRRVERRCGMTDLGSN